VGVSVFLSHSHKDRQLAARIVEFLKDIEIPEKEIRCSSHDKYAFDPGSHINSVIRQDIESALCFLLLCPAGGALSEYVAFEVGIRWAHEENICPLVYSRSSKVSIHLLSGVNILNLTRIEDVIRLGEHAVKLVYVREDRTSKKKIRQAAEQFHSQTADR
jgi:hypothetical protein